MFNKKLDELIADFQKQINTREEKINTRIANLETEAAQIQASIEGETRLLVEAELSEDTAAQVKAQKAIRKHNQRLKEVQDLAVAYRQELHSQSFGARDIEKIRAAAFREREARHNKIKSLVAEHEEVELQIQKLKDKVKQIDTELSRLRIDSEANSLMRIIKYIEPRAAVLMHYDKERYLRHWIAGEYEIAESIIVKNQRQEEPSSNVRSLVTSTTFNAPLPDEPPYSGPLNRPGPVGESKERRWA